MYKYITIFLFLLLQVSFVSGQGFAFGPKGGISLGNQNLGGYERDVLFAYHGAFYIESLTDENKNALFAQLGYHMRGSALRIPRHVNNLNQEIPARTEKSKFGNLALYLGGKQKFDLGMDSKWFFDFAIRGEYNIMVELPSIYRNLEDRVNKFVYGVSAGVGTEFMFSELVGGLFEFHVHPDISEQMIIPAQQSVSNPNRIIPEKQIRNITYEFTVGLRFLRKIIYID